MKIISSFCLIIIIIFFIKCSDDNVTEPQPQSSKGKLVVKSDPAGARIYLLGTDTGKITPDSLYLDPGTYDLYLYLQYYDTAYFSAQIHKNYTTTKEIKLIDGLPFVDIQLDYLTYFSGDSVKFNFVMNQDLLFDSIVVRRPVSVSGVYVTDRYPYNKEFFKCCDDFGNKIKYYLPPSGQSQQFYERIRNFTYEFHFYGQKAYGSKTLFAIHLFRGT